MNASLLSFLLEVELPVLVVAGDVSLDDKDDSDDVTTAAVGKGLAGGAIVVSDSVGFGTWVVTEATGTIGDVGFADGTASVMKVSLAPAGFEPCSPTFL